MKVLIQRKNGPEIINLNRRRAIRERCLNCSEWSAKEVSECRFEDCPLYPFRSGKGKQNVKIRSKAIRIYCLWCTRDSRLEISNCPSKDCPLFSYRHVKTDRSQEIKSLSKKGHIEPFGGDKNKSEYLSMGYNGKA